MASAAGPKFNFPGPIGTKRRRMRSGGNVSALNNTHVMETGLEDDDDDMTDNKAPATSKCKGATTIPIFLKKTYKMIDTCDPAIASWTDDGEMFVVKDPDSFATLVIPQYFDHNKFSSFARQLNFYGFRKMQSKPIRNSDYDIGTAKHVTFFNENFKRGRCDLLKKIQRSTRGAGAVTGQDQQKEVQNLRETVANLEQRLSEATDHFEDRLRRLELDLLARMEQMMLAMQQQQSQQQNQNQQQQQTPMQVHTTSVGTNNSSHNSVHTGNVSQSMPNNHMSVPNIQQSWDPNILSFLRDNSIGSQLMTSSMNNNVKMDGGFQQPQPVAPKPAVLPPPTAPPTLPPHPKQKQFPAGNMLPMNSIGVPAPRMNSLRGISTLSRGFSLSRGASIESSASAIMMRNSWEDKFFSMLMLGEVDSSNFNANPLPAALPSIDNDLILSNNMVRQSHAALPDRSEEKINNPADDFSSVSDSDIA